MKTIKKVTALLLSIVLLFSFVTTQVFAVDELPIAAIQFLPHYRYLTSYFTVNDVAVDSYAFVRVSEYYVNDCDMEATTWVQNPYVGDIMDTLYTHATYVQLYAEFESGMYGTLEDYAIYLEGGTSATAILFGPDVADVDDDDYLTYFESTHNVLFGIRRYHPSNTDKYDQLLDSDTIFIYKAV